MANFSDYIKSNDSKNVNDNKVNKQSENVDSKENLEKLIDKYSKLNPNDLFGEFIKLTYEKKKKGELKKSEIENIKTTIMPYLNQEQKENLMKILDMVENV